jgi:hypothetical protein
VNIDEGPATDGAADSDEETAAFDTSVAHQARFYDYLLGGKDNFAADRAYAEAMIAAYPGLLPAARANRAFLGRAVRFLAGEAGIAQFLDIGTGIPSRGSTHEVAQQVKPDSRIVYVDNDPVVLSHARALLIGGESGTTDYLDEDARHPETILDRAAQTLDFTRPVGVLLIAILHAIPDEDDPHQIVRTLMDAMPSGSYLVLTHMNSDLFSPAEKENLLGITREMSHQQYSFSSRAEVARFFDGLDLVAPGLIRAEEWRPDPADQATATTSLLAGVGRKP